MRASLKFFGIIFLAVVISCLVHEFGHFISGVILGNRMGMNLNMTYPINGDYLEKWHIPMVHFAGPVFSLLQAVIALILLIYYNKQNKMLYFLVLTPVTFRVWPYIVSPFMNQDEARVGSYLGIQPWILPVVFWLILGVIAWIGVKKSEFTLRFTFIVLILLLIVFQIVLRLNNVVVSLL